MFSFKLFLLHCVLMYHNINNLLVDILRVSLVLIRYSTFHQPAQSSLVEYWKEPKLLLTLNKSQKLNPLLKIVPNYEDFLNWVRRSTSLKFQRLRWKTNIISTIIVTNTLRTPSPILLTWINNVYINYSCQ